MPADQVLGSNVPRTIIKAVAGAAAGNVTVAGIRKGDKLAAVVGFGLTEGVPNTFSGIVDLTSEFTVTANDTINNTGGTSTAGKLVLVLYERYPAGLVS